MYNPVIILSTVSRLGISNSSSKSKNNCDISKLTSTTAAWSTA